MLRAVLYLVLAVAVGALAWSYFAGGKKATDHSVDTSMGSRIVEVTMPELSGEAALGAQAFKGLCAQCHGADAGGVEGKGPPLIHEIYEPGHHGDYSFVMAAKQGVRSHHWRFGDMPPVEGITDADIKAIIAYVREVQKENGIF